MSTPDIAKIDSLHPVWESRQFSKQEYRSIIDNLAKKGDKAIMVEDHSLRVVGTVMWIWQNIKGFFGFENQTDPIKVNYELLKLMRYGENHHYLEDAAIRASVGRLRDNLSKDKQFQVINEALVASGQKLDEAISTYVGKATNRSHLEEAFWPKLFHRLIAPVKVDNSLLQYNQGRIHAANGDFQKAIDCLHRAVENAGNKPDWLLQLATSQYELANQLIQSNKQQQADTAYTDAWQTLQRIDLSKADEYFKGDVIIARENVLPGLLVFQARKQNYQDIVKELQQECQLAHQPIGAILKNIQPNLTEYLTEDQRGRFYLALAKEEAFQGEAGELYNNAIVDLSFAAKKHQDQKDLIIDSLKAQLGSIGFHLHAGELDGCHLLMTMAILGMQQNALSSNPELLQPLIRNMHLLVEKRIEQQDYEGVIESIDLLTQFKTEGFIGKEFLSDYPDLQAKQQFAYAKIEQNKGNLEGAIKYLTEAQKLHAESGYAQLLKDLDVKGNEQYLAAKKLLEDGDFDGAAGTFQKLADQFKSNTVYKDAVIQTYEKAGDHFLNENPEKAIKYYQKALMSSGNKFGFYVNKLIEAHSALKDPERNVANYAKLAEMFPGIVLKKIDPKDYIQVANYRIKDNHYEEATKLLKSAYEQFPDNELVAKEYASAVYFEKMNTEPPTTLKDTRDFCAGVIELSKNAPVECYLQLAKVYAKAVQNDINLGTGTKLPKTSPVNRNSLEKIINSYKLKAMENVKHVADENPENIEHQFLCGKYLSHFSAGDDALPYLKKAYESDTNNIDYAFGYSEALYRKLDDAAYKEDPLCQKVTGEINAWKRASTELRPGDYLRDRWDTLF